MSQNKGKSELPEEKPSRTARIIQIKIRGMTDTATASQLRSERYLKYGQKTVSRT